MAEPGYPAARAVASRIQDHFVRHRSAESSSAPPPPVEAIEAIIDVAFWASLRREEGYVPRISLALVPPEDAPHPLRFGQPLPLSAGALVRVAPAVERPGTHLGIWPVGPSRELQVWGTTRTVPEACFVLEVAAPGLLVIKHHRSDGGKFVNVAVLEGDQVKVVDERASALPDCPSLLAALLGFGTREATRQPFNILVALAVSMREHGRGGSLLVVPAGSQEWLDSIVKPISYAVDPPFLELGRLAQPTAEQRADRAWQDALDETIQAIAGLTAVDGATVLTDRHELVAFGAKITRRRGGATVEQVTMTEPIEGTDALVVHPTRLGGTRHLSAAQFVQDQRDALALVASQDGRFTVFAWSPCENMVHAHRVESLLL